jgi:hypothetical protein
MTQAKFDRLREGDRVTLAAALSEYSCGHDTPTGQIFIPAGTEGVVRRVKVPAVFVRNGKTRFFVCVDFKPEEVQKFEDHRGRPAEYKHKCRALRVAAYPEELE